MATARKGAAVVLLMLLVSLPLALFGCAGSADEDAAGEQQAVSDIAAEPTLDERADELVGEMTLEQKVCQLFFVTPEQLTGMGQVVAAGDTTRQALDEHPVGGIIYFGQNLENPDQAREMLANTQGYAQASDATQRLPLFLGVDEEGGTVARVAGNEAFGVPNVGDMHDIGVTGDASQAGAAARTIGGYLSDLGFNVDFAPVADVTPGPSSMMWDRSFGSDPALVAQMVDAQVKAFGEAGVLCCVKHFPGIGSSTEDSHEGAISTSESIDQMRSDALVPFAAAIGDDVPFVMVGHLSVPSVDPDGTPASLSRNIITGLLREDMGYDGIVITDSLSMGAVTDRYDASRSGVAALAAGADMLLMPEDFSACYQGVLDAVADGTLTEDRIDQSVHRIVKAKLALQDAAGR